MKVLRKTIEFLLMAMSILLLCAGLLRYAFPAKFGDPSLGLVIFSGILYLTHRLIKKWNRQI